MTTYHRLGNIFYKADGDIIKSVKFTTDYVHIECLEFVPEEVTTIKEEEYVEAVIAATKYGFVGDRPDIPPPPSE